MTGAPIGEAFVWQWKDGVTRGYGTYAGYPIRLRLESAEKDGKLGQRVTILDAPPKQDAQG